jgi:hypothetical protein
VTANRRDVGDCRRYGGAVAQDKSRTRNHLETWSSPAAARLPRPPTPEAWYAAIEALRKSGRNAEADAELARFEAAYPGWIKKHHRKRP